MIGLDISSSSKFYTDDFGAELHRCLTGESTSSALGVKTWIIAIVKVRSSRIIYLDNVLSYPTEGTFEVAILING